MKKLLLSFVVLPGALATAQVGINTEEPQAMLDISAKDNQKGDLRIQDVEMKEKTDWLLIWDEKDQKVKRTSLSDLKWDIIVDKGKINYIRGKQPTKADGIINKIKQCPPENIVFDKLFGISGKHDFVYCATIVSEGGYNRTWLNLNLGAAYADINNPDFDPTVNKTGTDAHNEAKTYGSLYQWQRASNGHEFRDSETTKELADTWTETDKAAGKFITPSEEIYYWTKNGGNATTYNLKDFELWQAGGVNNPCPSGYHVPTYLEWLPFYQVLMGGDGDITSDSTNKMWVQTKLPNLSAAGYRKKDGDENSYSISEKDTPGNYWSSSDVVGGSGQALRISFSSEHSLVDDYYTPYYHGASVRCIKDY
ncbi:fibrobacter succinogenes major paralogous domain [Candidatus Ornithobacterium hominis]|uniref:FISUMP domain-containing protein n=1 Tax=Candidatus Ornithobacterium hominis TaxID=2497989 RepID=UPI000E5A2A95|nr:FISUMP domain-containing protein [Candidatus Ornithobacterium hominis]SZD73647.1 fibrobacter succinogenes major paralogous domain [Candidatus Ornithobacterium hominis]